MQLVWSPLKNDTITFDSYRALESGIFAFSKLLQRDSSLLSHYKTNKLKTR